MKIRIRVFMAYDKDDSDAVKNVMQEYGDWISENNVDIKHMDTAVSEAVFPATHNVEAARFFTYVLTIGYVDMP